MSNLLKNLSLALGLAVILWLGYVFFIQEKDELVTVTGEIGTSQVSKDTQELLAVTHQLEEMKIDDTLLSDPRFLSLIDYRQDLGTEPIGRKNPFAPVE